MRTRAEPRGHRATHPSDSSSAWDFLLRAGQQDVGIEGERRCDAEAYVSLFSRRVRSRVLVLDLEHPTLDVNYRPVAGWFGDIIPSEGARFGANVDQPGT